MYPISWVPNPGVMVCYAIVLLLKRFQRHGPITTLIS